MTHQDCVKCALKTTCIEEAITILEGADIRATGQRIVLLCLLLCGGSSHHILAEELYELAIAAQSKVSLTTVYNTLRIFTEAGLVKQVVTDSTRVYFEANTMNHHHIYNESTGQLTDIDASVLDGITLPDLPADVDLKSVELMIRVRKRSI